MEAWLLVVTDIRGEAAAPPSTQWFLLGDSIPDLRTAQKLGMSCYWERSLATPVSIRRAMGTLAPPVDWCRTSLGSNFALLVS